MALHQAYFWTGRPCQDIAEAAAAIAEEAARTGTGRLGPPIEMDGPGPGASQAVTEDPAASGPAMVQDHTAGREEPGIPDVSDLVSGDHVIRDSHGEPWPFATIPWIPVIDEQGKAQKIPAMKAWQQTPLGMWQKPDIYTDPDMPDEENASGLKWRVQPGRGAWRPDWEEGWVCNRDTGLWVVDVDAPEHFWRLAENGAFAVPGTRAQSTGRVGGGIHLLFDGRRLPEKYWKQGGLGYPTWGDLKCAGFVAAEGARHPFGPIYARHPDWPAELVEPPLDFADWIMAQRREWKDSLKDQGKGGGGAAGRPNVASMTGENRNIRLCSLRGILFNKVPEMDDDEICDALLAANEEFAEPLTAGEMQDTVLLPKPGWVRHPALDKPEPLTDSATPWLPKDPAVTITGLDSDGRVPLDGDVKKDNSPRDVLRLAWAVALGHASPHVAVLGRDLVVVSGGEQASLDIGLLDPIRLRQLCAGSDLTYIHHVKTVKLDDDSEVLEEWDEPALPSLQLCRTALADPAIRLYRPVLAAITKVPVLKPDGTLLEAQGVDQATSMVYWPDLPFGDIPAAPGRSEVGAAKHFIIGELLADFPWSSPADKAGTLAMLLTSYLQPFAEFLSPLFVITAPKSGSGKTTLVRIMQETVGAAFRSWVSDEAEVRKALTACLMDPDQVILFDDIANTDTVASATLASALTKRQWDDRVLGVSKNFRGTKNRTWALTSNNVKLGGDIPSRSVLIDLNPGATDSKKRPVTSFALGDLDVWIGQQENQVRVVRALLTLITAWADHGRPRSGVHHRFAEWAAVVGGVLEYHGVDGFLANQAKIDEHVHADDSLAEFLARWFSLYGSEPQQITKVRGSLGTEPELGASCDSDR